VIAAMASGRRDGAGGMHREEKTPLGMLDQSDRSKKLRGEEYEQSAGAASPSAPALYWAPAGSFQAAILKCGSSPHCAMFSTYRNSAERVRIVSIVTNNFFAADVGAVSLAIQPTLSR
jgi:hypothetical protein